MCVWHCSFWPGTRCLIVGDGAFTDHAVASAGFRPNEWSIKITREIAWTVVWASVPCIHPWGITPASVGFRVLGNPAGRVGSQADSLGTICYSRVMRCFAHREFLHKVFLLC